MHDLTFMRAPTGGRSVWVVGFFSSSGSVNAVHKMKRVLNTWVEKYKLGLLHKLYYTTNLFRMLGWAYHTRQEYIATDISLSLCIPLITLYITCRCVRMLPNAKQCVSCSGARDSGYVMDNLQLILWYIDKLTIFHHMRKFFIPHTAVLGTVEINHLLYLFTW